MLKVQREVVKRTVPSFFWKNPYKTLETQIPYWSNENTKFREIVDENEVACF